jgi:nicotinamidase-related amidase
MKDLSRRAALLLIDVQRGFEDPSWGRRNNPDAEANIARLLRLWRETGGPVLHVAHDSLSPSSPLRPDGAGNRPKPEAEPREGEPVFRKHVNSAFIGTDLEQHLRLSGVWALVVAGLTTNHCVSTTVRMASNLGFETFVVADATAAFEGRGLDGRTRPAAEVHDAALSDLQGEFATVVETSALVRAAGVAPAG